jgi:iron complex outermembrane receptor protein
VDEGAAIRVQTMIANGSEAESVGAEVSLTWQPWDRWQLMSAYTYLDYDQKLDDEIIPAPLLDIQHAFSLQSRLDLSVRAQLDVWLRYVDEIGFYDIDDYWTMDVRFAWQPSDQLQFSLHGINLLESAHQEYQTEQQELFPVAIERSYRAEIRYRF